MSPARAIRVLIADDHPVIRAGLASLVETAGDMQLVGEASDGQQAVALCSELRPDVTLMDLSMPRLGGADAIGALRAATPNARIIVLTALVDDQDGYRAIRAGASGFLSKDCSHKELWEAIRTVCAGGRWIPEELAQRLDEQKSEPTLTPRESEILSLVAQGLSNKAIGRSLGLTEGTVKGYLKLLLDKLAVSDRTEAAALALRRGLVRQK